MSTNPYVAEMEALERKLDEYEAKLAELANRQDAQVEYADIAMKAYGVMLKHANNIQKDRVVPDGKGGWK